MLENYTNLSTHFLLASLIASSLGLGIGLVFALRLIPVYRRAAGQKSNAQFPLAINALRDSNENKLNARARTVEKKRNNGL